MIVIADTAPLRYLIEIGAAQVLEQLFGKVFIPPKVLSELQGSKTPASVKAWLQQRPDWLAVHPVDVALFQPQRRIQDGEREAIALALTLKADAFVSDDGDAIKEARQLGFTTIRLFNILESAAELGLLDLATSIEQLKQTSFRLPPAEIIEAVLERERVRKQ